MNAHTPEPWAESASAEYVSERFCKLMSWAIQNSGGFQYANDCFCRKGGFWGSGSYGGHFDSGYRNSGRSVMWIEAATYACAGITADELAVLIETGGIAKALKAGKRATEGRDELAAALRNLYALVQGECPSLLENDHHDDIVRAALARVY